MSNYFQTLNRLEKEKSARRAAEPVRVVTEEPAPVVAKPAAPELDAAPAVQSPPVKRHIRKQSLLDATSANGENGQIPYLTLFDNLRLMGNGGPVKSVVLAGAATKDGTAQVSSGLALLARSRGLRVLVADVEEGLSQPVLRPRNSAVRDTVAGHSRRRGAGEGAKNGSSLAAIALDLRGGPVPTELTGWLGSASGSYDLVIVEAPALGRSVDAALLARACDGLILVVDSKVTTKDALRSAVDRAQAVGCRILGLVMNGAQPGLPRWMARTSAATPNA